MGLFDKLSKKKVEEHKVEKPEITPIDNDAANTAVSSIQAPTEDSALHDDDKTPFAGYKSKKHGLYPAEILMLSYSYKYTTKTTDFPSFWAYEYGVDDPAGLLESLLDRGFLMYCTLSVTLSRLKVDELKTLLNDHGLSTNGKKDDLLRRIAEKISESEIESYCGKGYVPSDSGNEAILRNWYVHFLHKNKKDTRVTTMTVNEHLKGEECSDYRDLDAVLEKMQKDSDTPEDIAVLRALYKHIVYGDKDDQAVLFEAEKNRTVIRARAYIQQGIRLSNWLAVADDKCCALCAQLNNTVIDNAAPEAMLPPLHPGCRCMIVPIVDGVKKFE